MAKKKKRIKLISWNVNGLRAVIKKDFFSSFHQMDADIFSIQETKIQENQLTEEMKQIRAAGPPESYYTGKEPLVLLLKELSKDKSISRLQLRKGNSFFEFRQK